MSDAPDLNALLQGIKQADADLKLAREDLTEAQAVYGLRGGALAVAQKAFDDAVLAARGLPMPPPAEASPEAPAEPPPDTRNLGPQGPLPPTSPVLRKPPPGTYLGASPYPEDDDRPEKTGA